jgi:hypothetical protein
LVGKELPGPEEAKAEAAKLVAGLGLSSTIQGEPARFEWLEVVDEDERPVVRLPLAHVIPDPNRTL